MNSKKLLFSQEKGGILFVLSAPSGTGKTTLAHRLLQDPKVQLTKAVTCTTRAPRANEEQGRDYHFISQEAFQKKLQENAFYEHASIFGEYYGTERSVIDALLEKRKNVLLVIDILGAKEIRAQRSCVTIFLVPPDLETLQQRLRQRATDNGQTMQLRLERAEEEFEQAKHYDYIVINDNLEVATEAIKSIIVAEEHAVRNL